ncbi:MAG: alpha/beta hydrolase, partial [Polyangiales bacterium]
EVAYQQMMDSSPPLGPVAARTIAIRDERSIEIVSDDGTLLDGRLAVPEGATRAVVLAHPHPLYGGSMDDPVTLAIGRVLAERGVATLRFDFRGVGRSEGRYAGGALETQDVSAAVRVMKRALDVPVAVVGYSFGSWVALRAARERGGIDRLALVAPAAKLFEYEGSPRYERPLAIAIGDRDGFCDAPRARVLAARLGASIAVLSGEDHFFARSRRKLAELIAPFLVGNSDRIDEGALV